ncbi:unnamed protein product [Darwinula stevensoni]|uniref:WW domain-containing protein n=1 Tax=Darwinula stevensoni TaxID=69355 RepID=A0A7R8XCP4_9CRUS|nr:unnamed protein product [Darwinula stevensoni]CAG0892197.1 unnamed protein product [Darwinula stevensoni]
MIPQVPSGEGAPDFDSDSEDELPPGWEERATPQGQVFYVNHVDKSTQWTHPRTGKRKKVAGELPFGWKEQVEPDGTILFIDTVNNKTTYSDPRLAFAVELKDDKNDIRQRFDSFSTAMQVGLGCLGFHRTLLGLKAY